MNDAQRARFDQITRKIQHSGGPEVGQYIVHQNTDLGVLVIDHSFPGAGAQDSAVGIVDAIDERAIIEDHEAYDALAELLDQTPLECTRRGPRREYVRMNGEPIKEGRRG